jgi:cell volume regulation protein A
MAVYLTLAFIALIVPAQAASPAGLGALALLLVQQFGWGAAVGVVCGLAMAALVNRSLRDAEGGVMALIVCAAGLAVFAGTGLLGGSGFLAVYLFGLVLANRARQPVASALSALDGYAWLAQAGMFLLLGLLVTPHEMARSAGPALGVAAALMFLARPVSVWVCLLPFRFRPREVWFIAWVGLRGAVPIVLAVFPLLAGVPHAMLLFNAAFAVVLASLLLQGTTIGIAARRLGVTLRAVFGDFTLDADAPVGSVTEFYGLPLPRDAHLPLGQWVAATLGRPAVVGDSVALGSASLSVRAMDGARITAVGLKLEDGPA